MKRLNGPLRYSLTNFIRRVFAAVATVCSVLTTFLPSAYAHEKRTQTLTTPVLTTEVTKSESISAKPTQVFLDVNQNFELQIVVVPDSKNMAGERNESLSNSSFSYCLNLTLTQIQDNFTECLPPLPKHLYFTDDNIVSVVAYSCMFVVAACGNLTVFITLFRNRSAKSRINMFIMHLAIADLIVTFIMLPLEIAWNSTVAWLAGDVACRLLTFFRAVGFYVSSFILVSISLDRYFAIMRPLSITDADTRAKMMLFISWLLSIIASIPQVRSV